jgi:putative transposase
LALNQLEEEMGKRKSYSASFKSRVALEAIQGDLTIAELASKHGLNPKHHRLSITRQCTLAGVSRSSFYYQGKGESPLNLKLMRLIDEQWLKTPFFGSRRMARYLQNEGYCVGRKRVRRLMAKMGIEAIYPRPRTSKPHPANTIYPYLLRGMVIDRPNQVWCADITYIPMHHGFMYLVAVMDWHSRRVLSWRVSNTNEFDNGTALRKGLKTWIDFYNSQRGHSSLDHRTPDEAYFRGAQKAA